MDCGCCGGACCEEFSIPLSDISTATAASADSREQGADRMRWLMLHADLKTHPNYARFVVPCSELTPEGACAIYPERPQMCRDFLRGGAACLDYVRRRRSPAEYELIRDDGDPLTIHAEQLLAQKERR